MLKSYYKRTEHINLLDFEEHPKLAEEQDLDVPHLENGTTLYDFEEIICNSDLDNLLGKTRLINCVRC